MKIAALINYSTCEDDHENDHDNDDDDDDNDENDADDDNDDDDDDMMLITRNQIILQYPPKEMPNFYI